jgi:phospholipase C
MIIASPWSRGGKVCSEVFDHTSTLQFLETFLNKKYGKNIHLDNISEWRRTICGNLTSVFSKFNGDKPENIPFLNRDKKVELIFNAQFKELPSNFNKLSDSQIAEISAKTMMTGAQEKGVRTASALPYELYTHGRLDTTGKRFEVSFAAGSKVFGKRAAGSPFTAYVPVKYTDETGRDELCRNWWFAVKAGDTLGYQWPLTAFENGGYHIRVHGPNGFYREFKGDAAGPQLTVACNYEQGSAGLTGNLLLEISNHENQAHTVHISGNGYNTDSLSKNIPAKSKIMIPLNLAKNFNWYDLSIKAEGHGRFEQRFAGRVETGNDTQTDPLMGGLV